MDIKNFDEFELDHTSVNEEKDDNNIIGTAWLW